MTSLKQKTIGIVGAGPKAIAIAIKACELKKLGLKPPRLVIIEKSQIAHHWKAASHFTNGLLGLGTSPEKDLGFPYYSFCWGDHINRELNRRMLRYSWPTFLIEKLSYSEWIDRGRPAPTHSEWAEYLNWALNICMKDCPDLIQLHIAELTQVKLFDQKWQLFCRSSSEDSTKIVDGLVFTGPGTMKPPIELPNHPRVLTYDGFWKNEDELAKLRSKKVALIGAGENAATIAVRAGQIDPSIAIDLIAPNATSYTRGESFLENHLYTDPFQGNWLNLTKKDRREFVARTDRGVFSVETKKQLDQMRNIHMIQGMFTKAKVDSLDQINVHIEYNLDSEVRIYDYLILAVGFNHTLFVEKMMADSTVQKLIDGSEINSFTQENIEECIDENLAIAGFEPSLHLPMLSGLSQGPGFANLSCLGRLSDHILARHIPANAKAVLV